MVPTLFDLLTCVMGTAEREEILRQLWPKECCGHTDDLEIQNSKCIMNPWNYLERLRMFKMLLNVTGQLNQTVNNKNNVLWGLTLQTGWQFHTGRLADPSKLTTCGQSNGEETCISERSWWGCMNYYLCAIPFLGASDAGLFSGLPCKIEISPPEENASDFCFSIDDCRSSFPNLMREWKEFFEFMSTSKQMSVGSDSPMSKEEDELLSRMWKAHTRSIMTALPLCSKRLNYLSKPEGNFGSDWATAVEFIGATHFLTNFQSTNEFQVYLPPRMLTAGDVPPLIADFSPEQNRVLFTLQLINKLNKSSGGLFLQLWKKAMCSEEGRAKGRSLMQSMTTNTNLLLEQFLGIVKELVANASCDV
ncbi:protein LEG1 homolog [Rhinophrynus dorsalis]